MTDYSDYWDLVTPAPAIQGKPCISLWKHKGASAYHVAHPHVRCVIVEDLRPGWIAVVFDQPVVFKGSARGTTAHTHWECNVKFLHETPAAAIRAHDPNWEAKWRAGVQD